MKTMLHFLLAVIVNSLMGATMAVALGVNPHAGMAAAVAVSVLAGPFVPRCVLAAGVLTEVWTGEVVKALRARTDGSWLDGIPDNSSLVNNDVIHLSDVGVEPEVLVNNTTYPIPVEALADSDIPIQLDKFQTKATPVTDDELHATSYDRMARVRELHVDSIASTKFAKAAHAICPSQNASRQPVLATTGDVDESGHRRRLQYSDVVALKAALDKAGVPADGRRLVLSADHVNDLLLTSQQFREQYGINRADGRVTRLAGFDCYENAQNPIYGTNGKKKAFGSAAADGEYQCSFAFYAPRIFKATGSMKMYYSEAATDPQYQRNLVNFRHYFIAMPKKADASAAIMSTYVAG